MIQPVVFAVMNELVFYAFMNDSPCVLQWYNSSTSMPYVEIELHSFSSRLFTVSKWECYSMYGILSAIDRLFEMLFDAVDI